MKSLFLLMASACICQAAVVVTVGASGPLSAQVHLAARFYGLEVQEIGVEQLENPQVLRALASSGTVAAIVSSESLSRLNRNSFLSALRRTGGESTPLLLVDSGAGNSRLAEWTDGAVLGCSNRSEHSEEWGFKIENVAIAGPLANTELPFRGSVACGLNLQPGGSGRVLSRAHIQTDVFPVFVAAGRAQQQIFVAAGLLWSTAGAVIGQRRRAEEFSAMAPLMMFLRYASGDKAWHAPALYANLTVDDPWLREPYGNLNYADLAAQMKIHNFHTTIAFVPWNFDRSESAVTALFRANPARFSIAIHGNNHNHREFNGYAEAPLDGQTFNLKQALARMKRFSQITGIPYAPVMVFPHAVSPAGTFSRLKELNYWATTNSENVPLGSVEPDDPLFPMRPETLAFNNFLSIKRVSAEVPVARVNLAINAFLGNPLLLYVHQEFFSGGAGAFNPLADYINRIAPGTQWRSLGQIVQHQYLQRTRPDGDYDVRALSPNVLLANTAAHDVVFHVTKAENYSPPIRSLLVDGRVQSYEALPDAVSFSVTVPARQQRNVQLIYQNEFQVAQIDVSRADLVTGALRLISDYRDNFLSRNGAGRMAIRLYAEIGVVRLLVVLLIILTTAVGVRTWTRQKHSGSRRMTIVSTDSTRPISRSQQREDTGSSMGDSHGQI